LKVATVRYAECVGMVRWPDGGRVLFGPDSVQVSVEPTLWKLPADVPARIDRAVAADLVATLPERSDDEIPKPNAASARTPVPSKARSARSWRWLRPVAFGVVAVIAFFVYIVRVANHAPWYFVPVMLVAVPIGVIIASHIRRRF
jgi:hypothetical protein